MDYVIFDLDGTLTEPYEGISKSILYAVDYFRLPTPSAQELRDCIGPSLYVSFEKFGLSKAEAVRAVEKFRERYHELGWQENALVNGAKDCVFSLFERGIKLAVATGKPTPFAEKILDKFGLLSCFSAVVGSNLDGTRIEKEEEILEAMRLIGATANNTAMVGDRKFDIEGAKKCRLLALGIKVGYAQEGELESAGADAVFEDFNQLTAYLLA